MPRRGLATENKTPIASVSAISAETNTRLIACVNLTAAKANQNNNSARFPERDLPTLFQPVIQPEESLREATGAEALCQ